MSPQQPPWRAMQPLKALYIGYFVLTTPPYLLFLIVKYSFKRFRPSPELSRAGNVSNALVKALFRLMTSTRSPNLAVERIAAAKHRAIKVPIPGDAALFTGVIAPTPDIQPVARHAIWFPSPPPSSADAVKSETVVLHFPGGGFILPLGHETSGRKAADAILRNSSADRFIWAQYRVAQTPSKSFPAAIQDAVTFYAYVLSLGYAPDNIVVSGDSAGGNVAITLLRYLEQCKVLPLPRGVMAWSPWVEVTPHAARDYNERNAAATDVLDGDFLQWGADSYRPQRILAAEVEAHVSPLHHPFCTSVPLFLHAGAAEAFGPAVRRFAEEMAERNGCGEERVRFHETPNAVHDLLLLWEPPGMAKEIGAAVKDAWQLLYA